MLQRIQAVWRNWRESRRQYQLERALYKAGGNPTGLFGTAENNENSFLASDGLPRIEAPKGKAPGPSVK